MTVPATDSTWADHWPAEAALALVTVAVAITSARLFRDASFLPRALLVTATGHAVAMTLRRRGVGVLAASIALVIIGALAISAIYLWSTTWYGLPTGRTIDAFRIAERTSFGGFRRLVAPVPVRLGYELALGIALWILSGFADTAAFRGEAPVQAVVPHVAVFVASSVYALGRGAAWATATLIAAICGHLATQRALRLGRRPWIQSESARGTRWRMAGAATITLIAVLVGALGASSLPGATSAALVDLRGLGRGPGPVEVGNPLVGISNLLGPQSNAELFTVKSKAPHYWRQTSLEEYDPVDGQWKTRRSYHDVATGERLARGSRAPSSLVDLSVSVTEVPGIWLPTAFRPDHIDTDLPVRYDDDSESLIASGRSDIPATSYAIGAAIPVVPEQVSDSDAGLDPTAVPAVYRASPELSPVAEEWFAQLRDDTGDASRFDAALEMQRRFRAFVYDANVDYQGTDPLGQFLVARRGFCQQFASAFALFARELGIPSRVAVGFSWGDASTDTDTSDRTTYVVRGRHAHAWPELYFNRLGWVAFDATTYTKVPAAEAAPPGAADGGATSTTTTIAASTGGPTTSRVPGTTDGRIRTEDAATTRPDTSPPIGRRIVMTLLGLAALSIGAVAARWGWLRWRRHRRRRAAVSPDQVAAMAWSDACAHLAMLGVGPTAVETPIEFGRRAAGATGWSGAATMARIETTRRYGAHDVDVADADEAARLADEIGELAIDTLDRKQRLLSELGWQRRN